MSIGSELNENPDLRCTYCGEPANSLDHLIPTNFHGKKWRGRVPTVPACMECNGALHDAFIPSIVERREYVGKWIAKRYRSILCHPSHPEFARTTRRLGRIGLRGPWEASEAEIPPLGLPTLDPLEFVDPEPSCEGTYVRSTGRS